MCWGSLTVYEGARVASMAVVVATGVRADGDREVLGLDVGLSEDAAFWTTLLRRLVARGVQGGRLVIDDAHDGLRPAIQTVMRGASWQRCRVHFRRQGLSQVPKASRALRAELVRPCCEIRPPGRRAPANTGGGHTVGPVSQSGGAFGDGGGGHPGVHASAAGALAPGLLHESVGTAEPGDGPPDRRCRELPNRPALLRLVGAVLRLTGIGSETRAARLGACESRRQDPIQS